MDITDRRSRCAQNIALDQNQLESPFRLMDTGHSLHTVIVDVMTLGFSLTTKNR